MGMVPETTNFIPGWVSASPVFARSTQKESKKKRAIFSPFLCSGWLHMSRLRIDYGFLGKEMLVVIFSHLEVLSRLFGADFFQFAELARVRVVCRSWWGASFDVGLWRRHFAKSWPKRVEESAGDSPDWYQLFKEETIADRNWGCSEALALPMPHSDRIVLFRLKKDRIYCAYENADLLVWSLEGQIMQKLPPPLPGAALGTLKVKKGLLVCTGFGINRSDLPLPLRVSAGRWRSATLGPGS